MTAPKETELSYIYFGNRFHYFGVQPFNKMSESEKRYNSIFKIGETADIKQRINTLRYKEDTCIQQFVRWEGTKSERLFIEGYLRMAFESNRNMTHFGNDHFSCVNSNTLKGAQNKFFAIVEEAFHMMEMTWGRTYNYTFLVRDGLGYTCFSEIN